MDKEFDVMQNDNLSKSYLTIYN